MKPVTLKLKKKTKFRLDMGFLSEQLLQCAAEEQKVWQLLKKA